ncbi:MAG: SIMPL domain-containing protein [Patescibacteria group bacterium]
MTDWKSPKVYLAFFAMILISGIIGLSIIRDRIVNQQFRSVTVNGQGKVSYIPDLAVVTLGVQIDKVDKADEALNQLNVKVNGIIKAVKELGILEENIQTQNYSLSPQYDMNKDNVSVVSGYNANQQLVIKVTNYDKDAGKLNSVIAAASKAGANQINNLNFDSSNINDLKQQARVLAIADAKNKSNSLAGAAGVILEDITGWYENLISPVPVYGGYNQGGMGAGQMSIPGIPISNREVVIEIGVTYNIK